MNGLDLFSGIGGITKALEGYVHPVAYCECDRYAVGVLLSRMHAGDLPTAPIWTDVLTLHGAMLPHVDIIYGGFPCQDISIAGRGEGLGGERSRLFFEIIRLCREIRPQFVFLENVAAITVRGAERVVGEFCRLGYGSRWGILSAQDVGANHRRERWWLLAHADVTGREESFRGQFRGLPKADGESPGCELVRGATASERRDWWAIEPNVGRVANGVPQRVDRLRTLGNAVVPAQAREAFERLMGL